MEYTNKFLQLFVVPTRPNQTSYLSYFAEGSCEPCWMFSTNKEHDFDANLYHSPHHMYLTSDETIEDGDWYVNYTNPHRLYINRSGNVKFDALYNHCKKIVATTDRILKRNVPFSERYSKFYFPNIPKEFIENFVKLANKKLVIDTVSVVFENGFLETVTTNSTSNTKFTQNPLIENGCVVTTNTKMNFSLDEMMFLIEDFVMVTHTKSLKSTPKRIERIENWNKTVFNLTFKTIIHGE